MSELKSCKKCGEEKPLELFTKDKQCKGGYAGTCKECAKIYQRANYLKNREAVIARTAAYTKANPEVSRAATKKWREKNIEAVRLKAREYNNSEQGKAYKKQWDMENIDKVKAKTNRCYRKHVSKRKKESDAWRRANPEKVRRSKQASYARLSKDDEWVNRQRKIKLASYHKRREVKILEAYYTRGNLLDVEYTSMLGDT